MVQSFSRISELSVFEDEPQAQSFQCRADRFYSRRFVFFRDVPVESDGQPNARFFDDFLLFFASQKFRNVIVRFIAVQAVVVDVHFPKNPVFRHFTEIPIGVFAERADKRE